MSISNSYHCLFCGSDFPKTSDTYKRRSQDFEHDDVDAYNTYFASNLRAPVRAPEMIAVEMSKCPACDKISVQTQGIGDQYPNILTSIYPKSAARSFPDYVPAQIREDYEEAYAIVSLSPKASATLARRALQSMIRDFFGVQKNTLNDELKSIESQVTISERQVLNNIRQLGNIGAHPERDINTIVPIEPNEAEKMLKVIEYFIDAWYTKRHDAETLFDDVDIINSEKQDSR